jgi:hypothetical protein
VRQREATAERTHMPHPHGFSIDSVDDQLISVLLFWNFLGLVESISTETVDLESKFHTCTLSTLNFT